MGTPPPLPVPPPPPAVFSPIDESQRQEPLDVVRGVAIFGIFLVNIIGFKSPMIATGSLGERWHDSPLNDLVLTGIEVLLMWKFVTLFALLFGIGMVLQREKASRAGRPFAPFFLRRMIFLLVLGVLHGIFLWAGDILATYAVCGAFVLIFAGLGWRTLVVWAGSLLALVLMVTFGLTYFSELMPDEPSWWREMGQWWYEAYSGGTWGQIVMARLAEWGMMWGIGLFFFLPFTAAILLAGMAIGKLKILADWVAWERGLQRFAVLGILAGILLHYVYYARWGYANLGPAALAVGVAASIVGSVWMSMGYGIFIISWTRSGRGRWLATRLAAVGRLALTNYLLQSLIANILFMSWGFGLYGSVDAPVGVLIVVAVFLLQLFFSPLWLRYFQIGPVEWLWRLMTYGKRPPLLRPSEKGTLKS